MRNKIIQVGDTASYGKTMTEADVINYAGITGDFNPIHMNAEKAASSIFKRRIVHGLIPAGLISMVLGTKLPGEGTIYLSQKFNFVKPVFIGDTITAKCRVIEILSINNGIYKLDTRCINQNDEVVIEGEAVVKNDEYLCYNGWSKEETVCEEKITNTFMTKEEVRGLGLASCGYNVFISRNVVIYNPSMVRIGNNVRIDDFTTISGKVEIGNHVHVAQFCGLYGGTEGIYMKDFSGLSSRVAVYATSNDYSGNSLTNPTIPEEYRGNEINEKVTLDKHVVIGTASVVLPGVKIGTGSAIGSMSLVLKNCEPWGIYVGSPVKRIKERSTKLLEIEKKLLISENMLQNRK